MEWEIVEERFDIANNCRNETLFAQGNGYIGMRGNFEEGFNGPEGTGVEGNYINGFYESEVIKYPEIAYGYAARSQTMLNVANCKIIKLFVEDEEFSIHAGEVHEYKRVLNFWNGRLKRSLVWRSNSGKMVSIAVERLVSFENKHLAAIRYEVTPLNFDGRIRIVSAIDGDVENLSAENDPRVGSGLHGRVLETILKKTGDGFELLVQKTNNSGLVLAYAMLNLINTNSAYRNEAFQGELSVKVVYDFNGKRGEKIRLDKFISYVTSRDTGENDLTSHAEEIAVKGRTDGYEKICREQVKFLNDFWRRTDVEIKGDQSLQQGIRFNIYHLLQSVGRDGTTNIGAKGLTGEGYEGHYFWDTETYILPFFLYNNPDISRKLLEYRYNTLDKARERARQMSHKKGALFPWRTIDGEECSTYFPAGTAQYHINADIAFAIKRYVDATADTEFLLSYGAEILFETARLWAGLGSFIPRKGNKFCINSVTGPDEYSAVVNNNCYTNLMAAENMRYAWNTAQWMKENQPEAYRKLAGKIRLDDCEIEYWKTASDNMYIPYDRETGIFLQDDSFLDRAPWDFENTPADKYPLLLHYHPLVIYRHQVCKQADLVLALFLLGHLFTEEEKKINYDFYERLTTHDSSLSMAVFSVLASEIGYYDKAYKYFMSTVRMDLDDRFGNTRDGIHAANMAGAWMCVVNGFTGMRAVDGVLSFKPYLPEKWEEYSFKIAYRSRIIKVTVKKSEVEYELLKGEKIKILHNGLPVVIDGITREKIEGVY